jgi:RNA polymerase sigma-70 factor (ECF subfamily)
VDDQIMAQRPQGPAHEKQDTDEVLIARLCGREAAALGLLYDRYAAAVYALASHTLGPADAEEVVQDVFLSLWTRAGQYDPRRGPFGAWFMALARHRVLDELRRRGARQRLRAAVAVERLLAGPAAGGASVEEEVWLRERGAAVLGALSQLPEAQRRVLVLSYFGGLSHATLAAYLGWPLGTVKKRLRLGLRKLRSALGGYAPQGDPLEAPGDARRAGGPPVPAVRAVRGGEGQR